MRYALAVSSEDYASEYRVRTQMFEGPLDLLLHLIRRAEVDIHDIPIASVARAFVEHLEDIDRVDVESAGDFLVMAATLMEIKSRTLMPPEDRARAARESRGADEDPREALIRRLLAYRAFREAGAKLEARRESWHARWSAGHAGTDRDAMRSAAGADEPIDLSDLDAIDLRNAYRRVAAAVNFDRLGEHLVETDDTPIEVHASDVLERLDRLVVADGGDRRLSLVALFDDAGPVQRIGLFLACLELTRRHEILVEQDDLTGAVTIVRRDPSDDPALAADAPHAEAGDRALTPGA